MDRAAGTIVRIGTVALHTAYAASLSASARRFREQLQKPERTQARLLRATLQRNRTSDYGERHRFGDIDSVRSFQQRVPVVDYDTLEPWIARIAAGEQGVLTQQPVMMLERTGGSSGVDKLIPYTRQLRREFAAATGPWQFDLLTGRPRLFGTRSYWSVSPAGRRPTKTDGGVPIGFESDTEYFSGAERWALERLMAVSPALAHASTLQRWREQTCAQLLAAEDLGFISVWSPTFLSLLMQYMAAHLDELLDSPHIPDRRAARIRHAVDRAGKLQGDRIWPRLAAISCWCDGPSRPFLAELRGWFPRTEVQAKGLMATEGVVSFPLWSHEDAVLAVGSHFLEFIDQDVPTRPPLLAHQLRPGGRYSVLMTTGGGLYRYNLKDVVECTGMVAATPRIRFVGKAEAVSDLCGEKVHAAQVRAGLDRACADHGVQPTFMLLAPVTDPIARYRLYLEADVSDGVVAAVAQSLDRHLRQGHHYSHCRRLGQLAEIDFARVDNGWARYQQMLAERGQRPGDIKPSVLDRRSFWNDALLGTSEPHASCES